VGVAIASLAGAALLEGCGLPSSTLALQLGGYGNVPGGMTTAPFTVAEIDVEVDSEEQGELWVTMLGSPNVDPVFDLAQLSQSPVLVAERDLPEGALDEVKIVFASQPPAPGSGALPLATGAPTQLSFGVDAIRSSSVGLVIDFDVAASIRGAPDGGYTFSPVAQLEESP
jgi:hypothetical protein